MTDGETVTVVSYNRPLTRGGRRALEDYGIVAERDPREYGCHTVVELETEPPGEVLEQWELRVEREPDEVWLSDHGERVTIFTDAGIVRADGAEQNISPEDAREHAERQDWKRVDDGE